MQNYRMTPAEQKAVLKDCRSGMKFTVICEKHNRSIATVTKLARKHGIRRYCDPKFKPDFQAHTRRCRICRRVKSLDQFQLRTKGKPSKQSHVHPYCTPCIRKQQKTYRTDPAFRERRIDYYLKFYYGITLADYFRYWDAQGGKCAICETPYPRTAVKRRGLWVDHCHATNEVRGLLCQNCNTMLGHARDSQKNLRAAIRYLESPPVKAALASRGVGEVAVGLQDD
jgi:hypothetical protein